MEIKILLIKKVYKNIVFVFILMFIFTSNVNSVYAEDLGLTYIMGDIPSLPYTGKDLNSFVCKGWSLLDSVKLDFNSDGKMDYVAVLEHPNNNNTWYPRILFAIKNIGNGSFKLSFQDINLIRTQSEGGVFGDPYQPLTTDSKTFTTHTYGGSAWRWSEDNTFKFKNGTWFLSKSESSYGYEDVITRATSYNFENGSGVVKQNPEDFESIAKIKNDTFELKYTVKLDKAPTLEQYSQRWFLSPDRIQTLPISGFSIAKGIKLKESEVLSPLNNKSRIEYIDEKYLIYTFQISVNSISYLALYNRENHSVNVISEAVKTNDISSPFDNPNIYNNRIFFSRDISTYLKVKDDKGNINYSNENVSTELISMKLDGSDSKIVFKYDNQFNKGAVLQDHLQYLSLIYNISGEEIIIEVYTGDTPNPFYIMNLDGSKRKLIGSLKPI